MHIAPIHSVEWCKQYVIALPRTQSIVHPFGNAANKRPNSAPERTTLPACIQLVIHALHEHFVALQHNCTENMHRPQISSHVQQQHAPWQMQRVCWLLLSRMPSLALCTFTEHYLQQGCRHCIRYGLVELTRPDPVHPQRTRVHPLQQQRNHALLPQTQPSQ